MAPLTSRSSVMFDLDEDGDLDIVTNDFHSAPMVLVSDLAERKKVRWLKVVLTGTVSNRNGLGAIVRVRPGGGCTRSGTTASPATCRRASCPSTSASAMPPEIDRVEVDWPSGRKQVVTKGLQTNRTLAITEPKRE